MYKGIQEIIQLKNWNNSNDLHTMFKLENIQNTDCSNVLNLIVRVQANQNVVLYNMRVMKFFRRVLFATPCERTS